MKHVEIYQGWHVGLHGFRCWVDTLNFVLYVASSVCFTCDLAHVKKVYFVAWFRQRLVSLCLGKVILLFAWLFCFLNRLNVLTLLCLTFRNPKIQTSSVFSTRLAEKGTHLGHWQTLLAFLVVNFWTFDLYCLWSSLACYLSIPHGRPFLAAIQTEEIINVRCDHRGCNRNLSNSKLQLPHAAKFDPIWSELGPLPVSNHLGSLP